MSLRYSLIGRGGQVIVSAGASGGNVGQVAEDLLSRINADVDDRKSYTADGYGRLFNFFLLRMQNQLF